MHLSQVAIPIHIRSNTLILKTIAVGPLQTNCYVIGCPETFQGAVIDPGWDASTILAQAKDAGLTIQYVLNTHAHWDHIGANADVLAATDAQLAIHPNELPLLHQNGGASMFGVSAPRSPEPDMLLEAGQALQIGQIHLQVLFTPGIQQDTSVSTRRRRVSSLTVTCSFATASVAVTCPAVATLC